MAFVEQLVTLGAVLAGAGGSYVASRLTDRDRFNRELRVRWDERRLDAYVTYVAAVKHVYRCAVHELSSRFDGVEIDDRAALLAEMRGAEGERSRAFEQVLLLGDTATIEAAHALNERLWRLERPARGAEEIVEAGWHARADEWLAALNDFHFHARRGLGVDGQPTWHDVAALSTSRTDPSV